MARLRGTARGNRINGTAVNDSILGFAGNDILRGLSGVDTIDGGTGNDIVDGGTGNDVITDPSGTNTLIGGIGNDRITGGLNIDTIDGGKGNDTLRGGGGNDTLRGGAQVDTAIFTGAITEYDFVFAGAKTVVAHARGRRVDGTDSVFSDVEFLQFAGLKVANTMVAIAAALNVAPVASAFDGTTNEDAPINGQLVASDANGNALTYIFTNAAGVAIPPPTGLTFDASGSFTYTPPAADQALDTGETRKQTFHFVASDGLAKSAVQTITLVVQGRNDAPLAADSIGNATEEAAFSGQVSATDVDDTSLTFAIVDALGVAAGAPAGVQFNANGSFTVNPQAADQQLGVGASRDVVFHYVANDGEANSAPQTVTVTIHGVNDAPAAPAVLSAADVTENGVAVSLDLFSGVSDVDQGDTLSVTGLVDLPAGVTIGVGGHTLTFDPDHASFDSLNAGEIKLIDIAYNVADAAGAFVARTARFTVIGTNDAPTATDVGSTTSQNATVTFALGGDDSDADDTPSTLTYTVTDAPAGTLATVLSETLTFDPQAAFQSLSAGDSVDVFLNYTATDDHGVTSQGATAKVTVTGVNDAPTLSVSSIAVTADADATSAQINLSANDIDSDNSDPASLAYYIAEAGFDFSGGLAGATRLIGQSGTIAYTGDYIALGAGVDGDAQFDFVAIDSHGARSTVGHITLTVTGLNDAPSFADGSIFFGLVDRGSDVPEEQTGATGTVIGFDPDAGDTLHFRLTGTNEAPELEIAGNYGTLAIDTQSGDWVYTLSATPDFGTAQPGDAVTEDFDIVVYDNAGGIFSENLPIAIIV